MEWYTAIVCGGDGVVVMRWLNYWIGFAVSRSVRGDESDGTFRFCSKHGEICSLRSQNPRPRVHSRAESDHITEKWRARMSIHCHIL